MVRKKQLPVPPACFNKENMKAWKNFEETPDSQQFKRIYDDFEEDTDLFEDRNVDGWSFVNPQTATSP